jgi:predicted tellurium resistance membrane protein TerC
MDLLLTPQLWMSLLTLTILELILGVDNLVFIAVVTERLPAAKQKSARRLGLLLAMLMRLLLLGAATWIITLTEPLFSMFQQAFSARDLFLIFGGLFLLVKGTMEIHAGVVPPTAAHKTKRMAKFWSVIVQIVLLDIIFSFDSVITAVGMTQEFAIMATAIIIAVLGMLLASEPLSKVINTYPSIKMLALSFLILVGMVLVADGFEFHVPRGYLYFAMAFSIFVECINILSNRARKT